MRGLQVFQAYFQDNIIGNTYNKFDPSSPFGGFKESGIGREGGVQGLKPYIKFNNG